LPIKREAVEGVTLSVSVSGLSGGHSGCDIHLHKANAFKLISRLLLSAWDTEFSLVNLTGGSARNAIPAKAEAVIRIPAANVEKFKTVLHNIAKIIETEYVTHETKGINMAITELPIAPTPVTRRDTRNILNLWKIAPSHPLRMSPDMNDLVESSCATTLVKWGESTFGVLALARTNRESQWHEIEQHMQAIADFVGGKVTFSGKYPGWLPVPNSRLSIIAQETHKSLFGAPCRVYAIHAGLECGILLEKLPHCEAISIGPEVKSPHSTYERCEIASGGELLHWVVNILKELKN